MKVFALVLVVAAAAFAGWFGWSWLRAAGSAEAYAETREEVLRVGEQGIAHLTTLDHQRIDEGLDRWLESSTGSLRDSLLQGRDDSRKRLEEGRSTTVGKVVDAAVTEVDQENAQVIAAVEITVTPAGGEPVVKRNRFEAGLSRTDSGWKLSSLRAVEVGTS
ncbi:nuclear transport factor 2 family protein [Kibdelosporangium persicum]|uniref:Mce-associated membrane protein n=1 Tax=Kibdelosporangium persicum TaxID=2698649 RepID=A0ABX2EVM8_9PSEU|nr:nuclear transport factor 2 family protein [Kibdelosporangium persicum]NRN63024.1 Mce-associated membrane protein [Kibdelosporangium persicum]